MVAEQKCAIGVASSGFSVSREIRENGPEAHRCGHPGAACPRRKGVYFSGHYTTGMDLLAPGSRTLASLRTRLSARGRADISHDL